MSETKIPYWKKLQDPRWQRKRLEVLSRDGFKCVECGNEKLQLQVHHRWYCSGRDPWEYPSVALKTLCEDCHKAGVRDGFESLVDFMEQLETEDSSGLNELTVYAHQFGVSKQDLIASFLSGLKAGVVDKESLIVWRSAWLKEVEAHT